VAVWAPAELARLDATLAAHRDRHALICLHHHALPMGSRWLDAVALANPAELFEVLDRHANVRGLLWGHVHQAAEFERNGVRLLSSPATCAQFTPGSDGFAVDVRPPAYRWLDLHADGRIETGVQWVEAAARAARAPRSADAQRESVRPQPVSAAPVRSRPCWRRSPGRSSPPARRQSACRADAALGIAFGLVINVAADQADPGLHSLVHALAVHFRAEVVVPSSHELYQEACRYIPGRREFAGARLPRGGWRTGVPDARRRTSRLVRRRHALRRLRRLVGAGDPRHADPQVIRAVQTAAADGLSFGAPTPIETELARLVLPASCRRSNSCAW